MALRDIRGGFVAARRFLFVTAAVASVALSGCQSSPEKQSSAASTELPPAPTDYTRIGTSKETVEERLNRLERDLAEVRIQYSGVKPELDKTVARNAALEQRLASVEQAFGPVTASISPVQRTQDASTAPSPEVSGPLVLTPRSVARSKTPVANAAIPRVEASPVTGIRGWGAHLGSFREMQNAKRGWHALRSTNSDLLAGQKAMAMHFEMPANGAFQRIVVGPMPNRDDAARLCNAFKQRGTDCNVLKLDAAASLPLD
jgi:cell division septation protein DedD